MGGLLVALLVLVLVLIRSVHVLGSFFFLLLPTSPLLLRPFLVVGEVGNY